MDDGDNDSACTVAAAKRNRTTVRSGVLDYDGDMDKEGQHTAVNS